MKRFSHIIFDLDSTLVKLEGLDWLAERAGKGDKLRPLTVKSMNGKLDFHKAMIVKMLAISPSYQDLVELGRKYCESLVEDVRGVIDALHYLGKQVWLLTGNFQPAVGILGKFLGISDKRIICNKIIFDKNGNYIGFNDKSPLAYNGGKARMIKEMFGGRRGRKRIVFVGDGLTDLEASHTVDLFIGYGGVIKRDYVKRNSDFYIDSKSMFPLLDLVLTGTEKKALILDGFLSC